MATGQACGRSHGDIRTADGTTRRRHARGRAGQDVGSVGGIAEIEEQRAFVEDGAAEVRLVAAEDERAFAGLGEGAGATQERGGFNGERAARVDLDGRGVGQVDVQTAGGGGVEAGKRQVGRGVEVAQDAAVEVQVTDGAGVGEAGRTGDRADEELAAVEDVGRATVGDEAGSQGTTEDQGADAGRAAVLGEGRHIGGRGERTRGFGGREAEDRGVEEAAVEGERTRAGGAGGAAGVVAADLEHGGADVELGAGEVYGGAAGDAAGRQGVDEDRRRALVAALAAQDEDRVGDSVTDGGVGAGGVAAELQAVDVEEVDRAELDRVRLAGGVGGLATESEATNGEGVDGGKIEG